MSVKICSGLFDPWQEVQSHQQANPGMDGKYGATCVFVGTLRDFNEQDDVQSMFLEHYPGMTERQLQKIISEAQDQWTIMEVLVVHRVGNIEPNEPIVLVAVWATHRGHAFDSNRYIMEALKSRAPFWKKEKLRSGKQRWLEKNTDGYIDNMANQDT